MEEYRGELWLVGFLGLGAMVSWSFLMIQRRDAIVNWLTLRKLHFKQWRSTHRRSARQKFLDSIGQ